MCLSTIDMITSLERLCPKCSELRLPDDFRKHRWCIICRREYKRGRAPKKVCNLCEVLLPYGAFAYNPQSPDGRHPWCNQCRKNNSDVRYCSKCLRELPVSMFNKDRNREDGYFPICKRCRTKYRQDNAQRTSDYNKSYLPDYYERNRDQLLAYHKDQYDQKYNNDPEFTARFRVASNKRRARKSFLPDNFSTADWQLCLRYWGDRCATCGSDENIQADHWIPLSAPNCPGTIPSNMIPLCRTCNCSKHDSDPVEWIARKLSDKAQVKLDEIQAYLTLL